MCMVCSVWFLSGVLVWCVCIFGMCIKCVSGICGVWCAVYGLCVGVVCAMFVICGVCV